MSTVKQEVEAVLQKLPDDCSLEDVQYQLYVMQKVQQGLAEIDRDETLTHEQVTQQLDKWLTR